MDDPRERQPNEATVDGLVAIVDILNLVISALAIGGSLDLKGTMAGLEYLRDGYTGKGLPTAAALAEYLRRRLNDPKDGAKAVLDIKDLIDRPTEGNA
jgi:hypothetical protein